MFDILLGASLLLFVIGISLKIGSLTDEYGKQIHKGEQPKEWLYL